MTNRKTTIGLVFVLLLFFTSCSTTKMLTEGQVLYTGVKKIKLETPEGKEFEGNAEDAVSSPLKYPPNNPLYSPYVRTPIPTGLWVYNWAINSHGKIKKWLFDRLAKRPVLIADVNPELRLKVAETAARDYGHFGAEGSYEIIYNKRNPQKAKISYRLSIPSAYYLGNVALWGWKGAIDTVVRRANSQSLLKPGDQYNIDNMEAERERISSLLRNRGYYYFSPEYIEFLADSTAQSGKVIDIRTALKEGVSPMAIHPYKIRNVELVLGNPDDGEERDSFEEGGLKVNRYLAHRLRRRVAVNAVAFRPGDVYTLRRQERTQANLAGLGVFRSTNIELMPVDSTFSSDYGSLDIKIYADYDLPIEAGVEFDISSKSNNLLGPGVTLSVTNKNIFKGGEDLSLQLNGAYEWQTQGRNTNSSGVINSYEVGVNVGLTVPVLVIPRKWREDRYLSERTQFQLGADLMNRNTYFRMLSLSGSATYDFQTSRRKSHSITPFKLSYTYLLKKSELFNEKIEENPAIGLSFRNQFIPSASYTYTYDRRPFRGNRNRFMWQATVTSAGNILSGIHYLTGNREKEGKKIFGNVYSQFLKLNTQVIYYLNFSKRAYLAVRLSGGIGYAYDNTEVMPYSEQFYVGGANSIRAFTVRTIGPGEYQPEKGKKLAYLDQTGDIKLEGNVEYRFNMTPQFSGALFLDTGNIWLLRKDPKRPGGEFKLKGLLNNLALGTGFGLRYDLTYLVVRGDFGIGLHSPYFNPHKSGYFNITKDWWAFHLAIGYPF